MANFEVDYLNKYWRVSADNWFGHSTQPLGMRFQKDEPIELELPKLRRTSVTPVHFRPSAP
ncbi:MAG: hypothetical protein EOO61_22445 [Hymenobacter sp.]|nr:MAG: hypothetical protein EOO61_22445 [Hymenobacter sp.]